MASLSLKRIGNATEVDRMFNVSFVKPNVHDTYLEIGKNKYCLPLSYIDWAQRYHDFHVRDDDVYLMGFPRSGNTWYHEMVWLIVNDLNFEAAKENQYIRVPFFEVDMYMKPSSTGELASDFFYKMGVLNFSDDMKSPRCIKTHLPWPLLPKELTNGSKCPKMIYILRNPKDVCISFYNLHKLFHAYDGSFEDFCTLFLEGRVIYGPYWESVLSFWKHRHLPNLLFIRYKDMKDDLKSVIKEVAHFLGRQLDETQIEQLVHHLDIRNMKNNPYVNNDMAVETYAKPLNLMTSNENTFIWKGESNGYLSIMSSELIKKFDDCTKMHLEGSGLVIE